jgi:hypothetical protein
MHSTRGVRQALLEHCGVCQAFFRQSSFWSEAALGVELSMALVSK